MLTLDQQNALRERYREANPGWRPATEVYAELTQKVLRSTSRLLDLGCGRGGLVEQLQHQRNHIVGLDPDILSLREHRLAADKDPLLRVAARTERLPFRERSFDIVFASWVLEHLSDPSGCFQQIKQALKPGGVFLFITPNRRHPLVNLNRLFGRLAGIQGSLVGKLYGREQTDTFPAYYRANTPAELERLAEAAGMRLTHLETVVDPTYISLRPGMYRFATGFESRLDSSRHIHLVGQMNRG
jgi:2-polyprenyl-3-methyl-5-hydroxy-6-metoxy-1,4-benzoquinol methylase